MEVDLIESYIRILLYLISKYNSVKIKKPLGEPRGFFVNLTFVVESLSSSLLLFLRRRR